MDAEFRFLAVRIAVALATAVGTISLSAPTAHAQGDADLSEKVKVRFTWQFKGEHAPLLMALEKGFYADEGLDVQLAEGSGAETVVKIVAQGIDKVGFGPATTVAEAISSGLPIRMIAVYQPKTPIGLMSFPDVQLKTPKDLEGKTLGLTANESFSHLWEPFAKLNGVDIAKVRRVILDYSSRNGLFISRKIDVQSTFLNIDVPLMEKKTGVRFNTIKVSDFGLQILGDGLFVNDEYAKSHPQTLRKLLRATAKGYRAAYEDSKAAVAALNKHLAVKLPEGILEEQLNITMGDVPITGDKPLGWQDPAAWGSNIDLLRQIGVIKSAQASARYYTNQYFESINPRQRQ